MKNIYKILVPIGLFFLVCLVFSVTCSALDVYVDDGYTAAHGGWGVTHFDNIVDAITAADVDNISTVYIYAGEYDEGDTTYDVDNNVSLIGNSSSVVTIYNWTVTYIPPVAQTYFLNVTISGLTFNTSDTAEDAAVFVGHARYTLFEDLVFENMTDPTPIHGYGLWLSGAGGGNQRWATVRDCTFRDSQHGLIIYFDMRDTLVENCTFTDLDNGGMYLYQQPEFTLRNSTFTDMQTTAFTLQYAGGVKSSPYPLIYNNAFYNCGNLTQRDVASTSTLDYINWNLSTPIIGTNIIGGTYIGGNFYDNYTGTDLTGDGIGDTNLPFVLNGTGGYEDSYPLQYYINPPTNINGLISGSSNVNLSWTKGSNADYTLIRREVGSYPTSITDGTQVSNWTGSYNISSIVSDAYYTFWSFNTTYGLYSPPVYYYFSPLVLRCYNESNPTVGLTFDILITNQSGDTPFQATGCTNPFYVNMSDITTGSDIIFRFSSSGYSSRTLYVDIDPSVWTNITCYLASNTNLYSFIVINEYNEPVDAVRVNIQRYINSTSSFENMSILYTDGAGQCSAYLIPNTEYRFLLTATGYIDKTEEYKTDPTYYGLGYPKYFKIYFIDPTYRNETIYHEIITFNGYISGTTLYVNYSDTSLLTLNISIVVYEINQSTGNISIFAYNNTTGWNSFQAVFNNINTSNCYRVDLNLNHTLFGFIRDSFLICPVANLTSSSFFDALFDANYGTSPGNFGWSNIIGFIILVTGCFSFGQQGSGIALIVTGFILAGINSVIGLTFIAVGVSAFIIFIGILVVWANQRKVNPI